MAADASAPLELKATRAVRGDVVRYVSLPGTVKPNRQVTLYSKVSGYLKSLSVEKGDIVRDGVAIGKHPGGIVEVEVDQAGHVVPAAEIQAEDVLAKVIKEFLDLVGQWVRLHEGHALDVVARPSSGFGYCLEQITPP